MKYFSSNLVFLREQRGIKQDEAAAALGYKGASRLNNYEKGKALPGLADFVELAKYYKVNADLLLNIDLSKYVESEQVNDPPVTYEKTAADAQFVQMIIDSYEDRLAGKEKIIEVYSIDNQKLTTNIQKLTAMLKTNYIGQLSEKKIIKKA